MKKQIENTDKLTDKAFSRMLITSLLGILVCIVCLGSSTWAWFSDITPSSQNEIRTADGTQLSISVKDKNDKKLENIESGVMLTVGETYTVTVSLPEDSSSGYCMISVGGKDYYSEYIHSSMAPKTITFTVKVEAVQDNQANQVDQTAQTAQNDQKTNQVEVVFAARWGIYARDCDVAKDGTLVIPSVIS